MPNNVNRQKYLPRFPVTLFNVNIYREIVVDNYNDYNNAIDLGYTPKPIGGSRRRARRPSRKYKKSAKRVFRKKSRSTRRR